jgi:hypothetical protein
VRKKWLILALGAALAVVAILVWLGAEDARQAALLDAREREAEIRVARAFARVKVLAIDGAPAEEVGQADLEARRALAELAPLRAEQARRQESWHARLLREARRRTGW